MRNTITIIFSLLVILLAVGSLVYSQECKAFAANGACAPSSPGPQYNKALLLNHKDAPEWGVTQYASHDIASEGFSPLQSGLAYTTNDPWKYFTSGLVGFGWFDASLNLPAGSKVIDFWVGVNDTNANGDLYGWLVQCPQLGGSCSFYPDGSNAVCKTSGTPGIAYIYCNLSSDNIVIDNFNNFYFVRVTTMTNDSSNEFSGMEVDYRLQVSPAPSVSDFTDVSTSNIFFPYIEAMFHSGITGGCTSTQFCPDSYVTRAQMAKFLSIALGLNWSH
jgi:S-layer homology domain